MVSGNTRARGFAALGAGAVSAGPVKLYGHTVYAKWPQLVLQEPENEGL